LNAVNSPLNSNSAVINRLQEHALSGRQFGPTDGHGNNEFWKLFGAAKRKLKLDSWDPLYLNVP
jgi:hypothetical protein